MSFSKKARKLWQFTKHPKKVLQACWQHEKSAPTPDQNIFARTFQLSHPSTPQITPLFKGILDGGCQSGDLISEEVVSNLDLWAGVDFCDEVIGSCLNGGELRSVGTLVLQVDGRGLGKVFNAHFHIVPGELPWQVILGASTCVKHGLLKAGAYGSIPVTTKKSKDQKAKHEARMEKHKKDLEANKADVKKDKKEKEHKIHLTHTSA